jgi:hypothetical protein
VYSGKISPSIAGSVASLLNLQMRAIQATDLEMRLNNLEQAQKQNQHHSSDPPHGLANGVGDGSEFRAIGIREP